MPALDALLASQGWTLWVTEPGRNSPKPLKVPVHPDGSTRHSLTNPAPLMSGGSAHEMRDLLRLLGSHHDDPTRPGYVGVGFRPQPGIGCLDLDNCVDPATGNWSPAAHLVFSLILPGAAVEVSVSGKGLHFWFTYTGPGYGIRHCKDHPQLGDFDLFQAPGAFVALGTYLGGDAATDCTAGIEMLAGMAWPDATPGTVRQTGADDWASLDPIQRAAVVEDLRAALAYVPDAGNANWIRVMNALKSIGEDGKQLWFDWSRGQIPGQRSWSGEAADDWELERQWSRPYAGLVRRSTVFQRAADAGWVNRRRVFVAPDTVFTPVAMPEGASHQPTAAAVDALNAAVAAVRATPTAEGVREAAFTVARMAAGGQIPWEHAREALALAAPDVDVQVLDSAHAVAKFTPLTAPAQAVIEAEQIQVSSKVGWLREQGLVGADAVLNERAMAFRVQEAHPGQMRRLSTSEEWIRWTDSRWVRWQHAQVRDLCMHEVPVMLAREMVSLAGVNAAEYAKAAAKAATTATAGNVASTLAFLPGVLIEPGQIDADPMLLGMNGGRQVLDLTTGRVRAAELGDYVTRNLGPTSIGDARQAVRWTRFLHEVFEGDVQLVDWIHRFCGYMLTGKTTEHIFLFLFGHGSNGKSVFTKALEGLMGEYGRSLQPTSLCDDKRAAGGATADLASLDGMRLVVSPEAEEGSRFAESLLKGLVGGDKMPVRQLYAKPYDMVPVLKLVLTGNHKPTIRGTDDGVWRRVRLVPFKANFQGREDRGLSDALANEMPHILAWAIEGCLRWQREGLSDVPASIQQATSEYRDEMDVLGAWLGDECEQGGQEDVTLLYANYKSWCERGGLRQIWTARVFSQKLNEYGRRGWRIDNGRTKHARIKHGLHLRNSVFLAGPK